MPSLPRPFMPVWISPEIESGFGQRLIVLFARLMTIVNLCCFVNMNLKQKKLLYVGTELANVNSAGVSTLVKKTRKLSLSVELSSLLSKAQPNELVIQIAFYANLIKPRDRCWTQVVFSNNPFIRIYCDCQENSYVPIVLEKYCHQAQSKNSVFFLGQCKECQRIFWSE